MDAKACARRTRADADGEAVWSRRPDAGVKFLRSKLLGGDGGKKARSPGRARYKPLKPLRREGRVKPVNLWRLCSCAFYIRTRGCGCNGHPAFPAPSISRGRKSLHSSGATCVARGRCRALRHSGMVRRTRPGISRFRVRCFASPRNDDRLS